MSKESANYGNTRDEEERIWKNSKEFIRINSFVKFFQLSVYKFDWATAWMGGQLEHQIHTELRQIKTENWNSMGFYPFAQELYTEEFVEIS